MKCSESGKLKIFTVEHRENISKALKGRKVTWQTYSNPSKLTWKLAEFLDKAGFEIVIPEQKIGQFTVDVLLANEWVAFEADGSYWHSDLPTKRKNWNFNRKSQAERDKILLEEYNLPVVRISEDEINNFI